MRHPRFTLLVAALVSSLAATLAPAAPAAASTPPPVGSLAQGADVSWPNCPKGMGIAERPTQGLPMPTAASTWVVVGLTNGPAFTPNPCVVAQVAWVKARHLWLSSYAITSFPTRAQYATYGGTGSVATRLYRTGLAQARYNVGTMRRAGITAPMVWIDVEPVAGRPWQANPAYNQVVVAGAVRGYVDAGLRVGFYSYNNGWRQIMGTKRFPNTPTWVPSGLDTAASAYAKCSAPSFSGGPVWLGQWTRDGRDYGLACPGVTGTKAAPSPLTPYAGTTLRKGSRGAAVVALQRRLALVADGIFGSITEARVMAVQRSLRVSPTGVVTTPLWKALGAGTTVPGRPSAFPRMFAST